MASQLWAPFVGGTYQAMSPMMAADEAVNVFPEVREVEGSPKQAWFYGTPGLKYEATVATVVTRGRFTQDGRTWVVVGDRLYERTAVGTYVDLGEIPNDGGPVYFASNGKGGDQLGIVGGGALNVLDLVAGGLTPVTLPFTGPVMIVFLDGYGLINQADSPIVWYSELEDLTDFDALDFITRSGTSDNLVGLAVTKDRVFTLGTKTTTQFYNSGDVDVPFLPYPGTTIQIGLVSPAALQVYNDTLFWVATSAKGAARVVRGSAAETTTISTPPIDAFLDRCTTLDDIETLMYEQAGHPFFVVTAPSSPDAIKACAYDGREALWHKRAGWNETDAVYTRWRARGCTASDQDILVGDYQTGDLYTLDLDTFEDNGVTLRRERIGPYPSATNQWLFLDEIELGTQPGVGLASGQGSDPVVELQISRDGAQTWISAGFASIGKMGEYLTRTIWRNCGRVRADRLGIRIIQTDPVRCAWGPGLYLRATNGTGQL